MSMGSGALLIKFYTIYMVGIQVFFNYQMLECEMMHVNLIGRVALVDVPSVIIDQNLIGLFQLISSNYHDYSHL